ncbi:TIGR04282 family arsenosugar biosynthesis glycosyltransferase [Sinimarinibacterium thermocellulolyticum]|uniref:TIGR04282 family arsenosugar biosynthesis glycosyltransferase n=1 Tax=Sinimarinibacterium thermocellulolyticum TaxID=3170016 RepID=A0ABV2A856_9GAMM
MAALAVLARRISRSAGQSLSMISVRTIVFAKAPQPGLVKTRLIPALGAEGAARLAARMLRHTVTQALAANAGAVELCVAPEPDAPIWRPYHAHAWRVDWRSQGEGDLGVRLARAARRAIDAGEPVLLIGTDCPALDAIRLREAARRLARHDAVIVPSADGGYVLLGLRRFHDSLFHAMAWSTDRVACETLKRLRALGWSVARRPGLRDIDTPADLVALPGDWRE